MLRICYCLSYYHPVASGAERQAHLQGVELSRRGHRVHVITRAVADCPELEVRDGVTIHRVIRPWQVGPTFGLSFVASLCRALRRLRDEFDLIHCHQALWEAVAAGIVAPGLGKPSLVQPAAGGDFGEMRQLSRTRGSGLLRRLIMRNSHFVAISAQIEHELVGLGVPAPRLTRLGSGVDTAAFSPGSSPIEDQLPARPRVLFLGRLHAQKNLSTLMSAWPAVRARMPASLLLAGDGPLMGELRDQAKRAGVADSVHFVGPVANPVDLLRGCQAFVLPSVAEGMSNSLLEAMAVGVPVIASRIGGNMDLVIDGENGVLVNPHDVEGWTKTICQLIEDRSHAERLGHAAREFVDARFSIRVIVDQYVALYQRLISKSKAAQDR